MLHVDEKFLNQISSALPLFKIKQRKPFLANFRCPFCGDSKKSIHKARGYAYEKGAGLNYKCHNCQYTTSLGNLIKRVNPSVYDEYVLENYQNTVARSRTAHSKPKFDFKSPDFKKSILDELMEPVSGLSPDHECVKYCDSRKIPNSVHHLLYYCSNIKKLEQLSEKYKDKMTSEEARLVLPVFNERGQITGCIARAIQDHPIKYLNVRLNEDLHMIYGMERVEKNKRVFVVEGPIDSLFLPNAIAVNTSALWIAEKALPFSEKTYISDNQPRNREIVKLMGKFQKQGMRCFVWPSNLTEFKDVNDLILGGWSSEKIVELVEKNSFRDLELMVKIEQWRKV